MDKIQILQLGTNDWNEKNNVPAGVDITYVEYMKTVPKKPYDMVFLDRMPVEEEIPILHKATKAYTLFVTEHVALEGQMKWLYECKKGQYVEEAEVMAFLAKEARFYYPRPYGEKYNLRNLTISRNFSGSIKWNGNYNVNLQGEFGEEFTQIAFWRNNLPLFKEQVLDLWLEYKKDDSVEIKLLVTQFVNGSLSDVLNHWEFDERALAEIVHIEGGQLNGPFFVSLQAKGKGNLQIIALHDRHSRGSHGHFIPGGERYVTSDREEIFCYFDPGDRKPPLNVYFSGYKTQEGFEGFNLMRSMGSPYLLIAEARLEGGNFYMGSEEYETLLADVIQKYMAELGFSSKDVIMSGLSMGTYGALYYGCDIKPQALILGKPLASIGDVAGNEKHFRPGGFPTSLDVLRYQYGNTSNVAIQQLNERFWAKFDKTDWGHSKFVISYMIEDDYDKTAYDRLLSHLQSDGVQIYGKGIHGRHNDNTGAIVNWFISQYEKILLNDFGRRIEK